MKLVKTKKNSTTWLLLRFTCLPLALQGYDHPAPERKRAQGAEYDLTTSRMQARYRLHSRLSCRYSSEPQVRRFQIVIANRAAHRDSRVNGGSPPLQTMVPGAMKHVGNANRSRRRRDLDPCKQRVIVHNGIRKKSFINAAVAKVDR